MNNPIFFSRIVNRTQVFADHFVSIILGLFAGLFFALFFIVARCEMSDVVEARGRLEPQRIVYIKAPYAARVKMIHIPEQRRVKKGQLIVELEKADIEDESRMIDVEMTRLKTELFSRRLQTGFSQQKRYSSIVNLEREQSQLCFLLELQKRSLSRVRSSIRELEQLGRQGLIAQHTLDPMRKEEDALLGAIKTSETNLRRLKRENKLAHEALSRKRAEKQEIATLEKLFNATLKKKAFLKKRIDAAEIRAPFEGFIIGENLERLNGSQLAKGETILAVFQDTKWMIKALIDEQNMRKIRVNQPVKISLNGFPVFHFPVISGKVAVIDRFVLSHQDSASGVPVEIALSQIPENYQSMRPGIGGRAKIIVDTDRMYRVLWRKIIGGFDD